jgi:ubiquinone biosynthesis protein COQ4
MQKKSFSIAEKAFLASGSATMAFLNPWRGDMIAVLSEVTGEVALKNMRTQMMHTDEGRQILIDKPRFNSKTIDLNHILKTFPSQTLGFSYAKFMADRGFDPDSRLPVKFVEDDELAYVLQRYREMHDLWHVLLGLETNVEGELAQKIFEFLQTGLPMCAISSIFGPLRLSFSQQVRMATVYLPWALDCHASSKFLMGVRMENYLERDLNDVRNSLRIKPFRQ